MSEQLGTCRGYLHSRIGIHPEGGDCIDWNPVPAPAEPAKCPACGYADLAPIHGVGMCQDSFHTTPSSEPVAGETNVTCQHCQTAFYSANTQLAKCPKCKRTLALFHAPSVAGETKHCTIPPDGWTCSRDKGHEGPCAARPLTTTECDEGLSKEIGEELGFEVKRWDGDVLIRDSDSTEWTSAVAWARSAPQTVAAMLSDAFTSFVQCRARIVRGATPLPAPSVAAPEGEAKPDNDKWRVGRKLGRTLYIGDRFIGSVDTPELASKIVEAVNAGGVSTAQIPDWAAQEIAALRKRLHHLEGHNQYFFRCESAWCHPDPRFGGHPAMETLRQLEERAVKAEELYAHVLAEKGKR